LQDDPQLTVREVGAPRQPLKIVIDRHCELPPKARLFESGRVLIVTAEEPRRDWPNAETIVVRDADGRVDLAAMLRHLAQRELNEIHVEAGARLNGALLAAGLVDELLIYLAPNILGDPARGMFALPSPLSELSARVPLEIRGVERVGDDWRIVARVVRMEDRS
jgi:diaminohydroxyphosphoribosylaminopyrimidine deaminase/5-amino-6-(5-phosphoribosylamino)uracil reductase